MQDKQLCQGLGGQRKGAFGGVSHRLAVAQVHPQTLQIDLRVEGELRIHFSSQHSLVIASEMGKAGVGRVVGGWGGGEDVYGCPLKGCNRPRPPQIEGRHYQRSFLRIRVTKTL